MSAGESYLDWFFGNMPGCIGETFSAWIIAAFIIMVICRVIDWRTPVTFVLSAIGLSFVLSGTPLLHSLLTGGLLLGAVFMATDYVTTPVTPMGRIIVGLGCGAITAIIRAFSGYPEGVMFSILIMNALVGFLNKLIPHKYGYVKPNKGAQK